MIYYVHRFCGMGTAGPGVFLLHDTWGLSWRSWQLSDTMAQGLISSVSSSLLCLNWCWLSAGMSPAYVLSMWPGISPSMVASG